MKWPELNGRYHDLFKAGAEVWRRITVDNYLPVLLARQAAKPKAEQPSEPKAKSED